MHSDSRRGNGTGKGGMGDAGREREEESDRERFNDLGGGEWMELGKRERGMRHTDSRD